MARRLVSTMTRMKGGPTLGGSPTRVYVYNDEALSVLSTLYQRATGGGTQPNYITPNAGKQTTLRSDAASGDTVLNVVSIASFAVGDMVPVFDGTNIRWRVITAVNATGPTMTVDQTLGVAFDSDNSFINRPSMRGHVWFWVDDVRDYFLQPYDVGAAEQMPPLQIPTQTPVTTIEGFEEGASVASRGRLNAVGTGLTMTDDAGNGRLVLTHGDLAAHGGYVVLTTVEAVLSADVTLSVAGTYYDGPSVSITAGTWLLTGVVIVDVTAGGGDKVNAKLWDGTTTESVAETGPLFGVDALPVIGIVTVGSTTTWKVSCVVGANGGAGGSYIRAAPSAYSPGNYGAYLRALRIA